MTQLIDFLWYKVWCLYMAYLTITFDSNNFNMKTYINIYCYNLPCVNFDIDDIWMMSWPLRNIMH
jgi:hypothetical protein